jgi:hypothetical protein
MATQPTRGALATPASSFERCVVAIREMMLSGELLPARNALSRNGSGRGDIEPDVFGSQDGERLDLSVRGMLRYLAR